jgi:ribosomal protein L13E
MDNYYLKYIKYKSKYLELKGIKGCASINNDVRGGGNDDSYYTKYMKYKNKYIKEKGLVGGELKECKDVGFFKSFGKSVWWYIRNTDCNYDALLQKIPDKVRAITYADFQSTNSKPEHQQQPITIAELKLRGFPAEFLKGKGFTVYDLIKNGSFTTKEFLFTSISVKEIIEARKKIGEELGEKAGKEAGTELGKELGDTYFKLLLKEFIDAKYSIYLLIKYGYKYSDFNELFNNNHINEEEMISLLIELVKHAGFTAIELKNAGFDADKFKEWDVTAYIFKRLDYNIKYLIELGFTLNDLKEAGFSAGELKEVGFSASELKGIGFTLQQLKNAGFTLQQLKNAGFTLQQLKNTGFTLQQLKIAGFTLQQLKNAGFTLQQLATSFNLEQLRDAGFTATELNRNGLDTKRLREYFTLQELINEGFSTSELKEAGFKFVELLTEDENIYRNKIPINKLLELKNARFDIREFKGVPAQSLKQIGFSISELINIFLIADLKTEFSEEELKQAGIE